MRTIAAVALVTSMLATSSCSDAGVAPYAPPPIDGDMPAFGYFLRHVDGVTFTNSTPTVSPADARRWLEQRGVTNVTIQ